MIYLDYSANTPSDERVIESFVQTERQFWGNPNSTHVAGRAAEAKMEEVTASIAELLGCESSEIIYTSGASESNNLAIKGIAEAHRHVGRHIISTTLEHSSVGGALTYLQNQGYEVDLLDLKRDGTVDLEHLRELLRKDTVLVVVGSVDSEIGILQPTAEIAKILQDYPKCHFHVDATQAVGKIPLRFEHCDTMSIAPHKFYGINGSGLLLKKKDLVLAVQIHGGASTTLYRSGTPALSLAASTQTALSLAVNELPDRMKIVRAHNDRLRAFLSQFADVYINSPAEAVPHILNISVKGVKGSAFQQELSAHGVCVSVKSACSSDGMMSKAVFAVSRDRKRALSSWRISLSHLTGEDEIEAFCDIFKECYQKLHG